jgi:chaperonin GroEL (HSP60 family)
MSRKIGDILSDWVSNQVGTWRFVGVLTAVTAVAEIENGKVGIDLDNIQVEKRKGQSVGDTELIKGIILDKEIAHAGMPKKVEAAKIALIDCALEIGED